jgi:hypothetical protein
MTGDETHATSHRVVGLRRASFPIAGQGLALAALPNDDPVPAGLEVPRDNQLFFDL